MVQITAPDTPVSTMTNRIPRRSIKPTHEGRPDRRADRERGRGQSGLRPRATEGVRDVQGECDADRSRGDAREDADQQQRSDAGQGEDVSVRCETHSAPIMPGAYDNFLPSLVTIRRGSAR